MPSDVGEIEEFRWFEINFISNEHEKIVTKNHWPLIKEFLRTYPKLQIRL